MTVYVTNLASHEPVTEDFITRLREMAQTVLEQHGLASGQVGIVLAGDVHLRDLNYSYRGLDSSTDVLSFSMLDQQEKRLAAEQGREVLVGDIYISVDKARAQALEASHPFLQEVMQLAIHGMLHLLGFSHHNTESGRAMAEQEREIFRRLAPIYSPGSNTDEPDGSKL